MKKFLGATLSLFLVAGCGSAENAGETARADSPTPLTTTAKQTTKPKPTPSVDNRNPVVGEVKSCSSIRFHSKPTQDLIINCLDGAQGFNVGAIEGPAIINVWGSWCPPCVKEIPIFVDFYSNLDPSVQLVGIDFQDGPRFAVEPFIVKSGMTWPNLADQSGAVRAYFGSNVPVTWFINADNNVAYKKFGPVESLSELQSLSKKYLGIS